MPESEHENRWRVSVEITEARLEQAREEFPATMPTTDPSEWSETDFIHALAALYHRDFAVVQVEPIEGT